MLTVHLTSLSKCWTQNEGEVVLLKKIAPSHSSPAVDLCVPSQWLPLSRSGSWPFCRSTTIAFRPCSSGLPGKPASGSGTETLLGETRPKGVGPCLERHLMGFSPPPWARTTPSEAARNGPGTQREYSGALCSGNTSLIPIKPHATFSRAADQPKWRNVIETFCSITWENEEASVVSWWEMTLRHASLHYKLNTESWMA